MFSKKNAENRQQCFENVGDIAFLIQVMFYMETAEQDKLIPITVRCPFEAVLEKVSSLLEEMEEERG